MRIVFNTGRQYTAEGQIIIAEELDSHIVLFKDISRGVDGVIHHAGLGVSAKSTRALRRLVEIAYDNNIYTFPRREPEAERLRDLRVTEEERASA